MDTIKDRVLDPRRPPFERLVALLAILRSPEGCAWDRKQTHRSLLPYLIEETYEVVEAVENDNPAALREELGDLLVQIVFHAQLAAEAGRFTIDNSIADVVEKLVARHPHVFGERKNLNPRQVRDQWEQIKVESGEKDRVLSGVPKAMPALTMAYRVGEKAGGVGFDWNSPEEVLGKIEEEIGEIR
ncbi:MAG TPA: nucleoside triphosphate pyrophosphohydrolase, partial [candidate division Zixibacteria bacterium]|nr:nucleoside triphosphate pyrophosphohydrolase [candidate division Zixibacteria bacterium]